MPKIVRLEEVYSIKPGDPPDVAPDGTILNPVPYHAADIWFDDGITVQVERPLTPAKVRAAYQAARAEASAGIDEIALGHDVTP